MELNRWIRRVRASMISAIALNLSLTSGLALSLTGCDGGEGTSVVSTATPNTDPVNPAPAAAKSGSVTLSWASPEFNEDGSPLKDLMGFHIHYGLNPDALDLTVATGPGINDAVIEDLSSGTWYFEVVAVNSRGMESDSSGIASDVIDG